MSAKVEKHGTGINGLFNDDVLRQVTVSLTSSELINGALAGMQRQVDAIEHKRIPTYGSIPTQAWQQNIEGALGELAVAKALGLYYPGKGEFGIADVAGMQVRTTAGHKNRLILHTPDKDDEVFILVTGMNGEYVLRGWVYGHEGKTPQFWTDPVGGRPAFFVPQYALRPISTLPLPYF